MTQAVFHDIPVAGTLLVLEPTPERLAQVGTVATLTKFPSLEISRKSKSGYALAYLMIGTGYVAGDDAVWFKTGFGQHTIFVQLEDTKEVLRQFFHDQKLMPCLPIIFNSKVYIAHTMWLKMMTRNDRANIVVGMHHGEAI